MELEPRVVKLETNHSLLVQEFGQINKTLEKIEIAIEKQNTLFTEIRLLSNKIEEQDKRITGIENSISKLVWIIITAVLGSVMALTLKG